VVEVILPKANITEEVT
jgi:hypothetical protein